MRHAARGVLFLVALWTLPACGDGDDESLVETDAVELIYAMSDPLSGDDVDQIRSTLEQRLAALGAREVTIEIEGDQLRIGVGDPAGSTVDDIEGIVGTTAELRFRPVLLTVPVAAEGDAGLPLTAPDLDDGAAVVVLEGNPEDLMRYQLGPAGATGTVIETAQARLSPSGGWAVGLTLTVEGLDAFNAMAAQCFPPSDTCPAGQLAIVLDSVVESAPTVQQPSFERDQIEINGSFTEEEAKQLALVLRYGSLPTTLTPL